jgi:hypothetical protein
LQACCPVIVVGAARLTLGVRSPDVEAAHASTRRPRFSLIGTSCLLVMAGDGDCVKTSLRPRGRSSSFAAGGSKAVNSPPVPIPGLNAAYNHYGMGLRTGWKARLGLEARCSKISLVPTMNLASWRFSGATHPRSPRRDAPSAPGAAARFLFNPRTPGCRTAVLRRAW